MNDPSTIPPTDEETSCAQTSAVRLVHQIESAIRRNPLVATLTTVGIGCAIAMAARELLAPPPSPKQRALRLLEDIQQRLNEIAEPAYDRASHLADEGVSAVRSGLHSVSESNFGNRLRHLFS